MKKITKIAASVAGSIVVATGAIVPTVVIASNAASKAQTTTPENILTLGVVSVGATESEQGTDQDSTNIGEMLSLLSQLRTERQERDRQGSIHGETPHTTEAVNGQQEGQSGQTVVNSQGTAGGQWQGGTGSGTDATVTPADSANPLSSPADSSPRPRPAALAPVAPPDITGPLVVTRQTLLTLSPSDFHSSTFIIRSLKVHRFDVVSRTVTYDILVRSIATNEETTIQYRMALDISDNDLIKMATVSYKNSGVKIDRRVALRLTHDQFATTIGHVVHVTRQFNALDELYNTNYALFSVTIQLNNALSTTANVAVPIMNSDLDSLGNVMANMTGPEGGLNEGNKNQVTVDNFHADKGEVVAFHEPTTWEIGDNNFYTIQVKLREASTVVRVQAPHYETLESMQFNAAKVKWTPRSGQSVLHEREKASVTTADFTSSFGTVTSIQPPADLDWRYTIVNYMVEVTSPHGTKRVIKVAVPVVSNAVDALETTATDQLANVTVTKVNPNLKIGLITRGTIGPQSFKASAGTILGVYPTTDPNEWGDTTTSVTYNVIVAISNQRKTFQVEVPYQVTDFDKAVQNIRAHHVILNGDVSRPPQEIWDVPNGFNVIQSELVRRGRFYQSFPRNYNLDTARRYNYTLEQELEARQKLTYEYQKPPFFGSDEPAIFFEKWATFLADFEVDQAIYYPLALSDSVKSQNPGLSYANTDPYYRDDFHHIYGPKITSFMRWFVGLYTKYKDIEWPGLTNSGIKEPYRKMNIWNFYQRVFWNIFDLNDSDQRKMADRGWTNDFGVGFSMNATRGWQNGAPSDTGLPENNPDRKAYFDALDIARNFMVDSWHVFNIPWTSLHNLDPSVVYYLAIADDFFADWAIYDLTLHNPDTNTNVTVRVEAPVNAVPNAQSKDRPTISY